MQISKLVSNELNEYKNIIYSSVLYIGNINFDYIIKILEIKTYSNDLYIINVSWVRTIDLTEGKEVNIIGIPFKNMYNEINKLYII